MPLLRRITQLHAAGVSAQDGDEVWEQVKKRKTDTKYKMFRRTLE